MGNIKITVQYDGTNYHGWQVQPNRRTIQGELTRVLSLLEHRPVTVCGAGRTDAGVHALGQVANFFARRDVDPATLRDAINGNLDRDIRVIRIDPAPDEFDARRSARQKTYRYCICTDAVVSPFEYRYVYHYRAGLDCDAMRVAAGELVGTHDFTAFTVSRGDVEDHIRTLNNLEIAQSAGKITITASGNGFLRYMVRTIAGTLIDVGRGKRTAESVGAALSSLKRSNAGPTAPACGLTLVRVDY